MAATSALIQDKLVMITQAFHTACHITDIECYRIMYLEYIEYIYVLCFLWLKRLTTNPIVTFITHSQQCCTLFHLHTNHIETSKYSILF